MIVPPLQILAQVAIERVLNSLPESLLVVLFAWALLRILPRQNSRTRFALWFVALLSVAALPIFGGFLRPQFTSALFSEAWFSKAPFSQTMFSHAAPAISLPASLAAIFFIAWAAAASVMMARLVVGLWRLRELRRTCNPVDPAALDPSLCTLFAELNAAPSLPSRPVTLATSDRIRVPAAIGLWKPMIVLPAWALRDLPPSDLGIVLRHEFAHLRHWDDWSNLVQKIVRALFFFHPAVWWIENRLSVEREMACDDVVVAQTANPAGYASCLVSLLERSLAGRGWTMAQAFVHRARETSMRLSRILDNNRPVATRISKPALGLVGAFAVLSVVMLPNTPRVVSFEQAASADTSRSAALVSPAITPASAATRANFTASPYFAAATPASFKTSLRLTSPSSRKKVVEAPANSAAVIAARAASPIQQAPSVDNAGVLAAENAFLAAVSHALFEESAFLASQHGAEIHPVLPAVLVIRTTEFVESDSASPAATRDGWPAGSPAMVWRVQVWRVMFVDPTWERKVRAPVAHST